MKTAGTGAPIKFQDSIGWAPTTYRSVTEIECTLDDAWPRLLRYQDWNPGLASSQSTRLEGQPDSEGEIVLIEIPNPSGPPIEFYVQTLCIAPKRRIVWYAFPKVGESFRNFVDFELIEIPIGVAFTIRWFSLDMLAGDALTAQRVAQTTGLRDLGIAFKKYCESGAADRGRI